MQNLKEELFARPFSHIYVEKKALEYNLTEEILSRFKSSKVVEIEHYKDVFSRGNQDFYLQKKSPKLILAVKEDNLIYKGAEVCQDFGNKHFYYTSIVMNCIYDCEYCYLQGMYTSANIVLFVNIDDYFAKVKELLKEHPVYLCISYDTDLLAFEGLTNYVRKFIQFAMENKDLTMEIRTKSGNFKSIKDIEVQDNVILAWTLSPEGIIKNYEDKTPCLERRIKDIKDALDKGWKVRLSFDPILYIKNWRDEYKTLVEEVFSKIDGEKILDVSIGLFRVSKDYLKVMRKQRPNSIVLNYPYHTFAGVCSYDRELGKEMLAYLYTLLKTYVDQGKIYM
ncbi:SPL family radical SAM protein [Anaerobranca gottschalkii]|uniref:Spore photoproduct lyase n=1 Tax=Anaerobranca gottschalkii DSM 13577 TaxID=1120990 RepID=A0A1H9ZXB2_9FIRM|nr:DNA repair photolyase [Anaerobranca gottschalkii]SES86445.1 spore photoproduct lyase [Anaerobranca gottschalkii DSM 13577]